MIEGMCLALVAAAAVRGVAWRSLAGVPRD